MTVHNMLLGNHENPNDVNVRAVRIKGFGKEKTISLTTSSSTTDELFCDGLGSGCLFNPTTELVTITWWHRMNKSTTISKLYDEVGDLATNVIPGLGTQKIHSACQLGVKNLRPVTNVASTEYIINMSR